MNDFFNVLDDFQIEDFVAEDSDLTTGFSFDTASDSSGEPVEEDTDEYVNNVAEDPNDITEEDAEAGHNYVWQDGENPFSGDASKVAFTLSDEAKARAADGENEAGVAYKNISIRDIVQLVLEKAKDVANAFTTTFSNGDFDIAGSLGNRITLTNGRMTGGTIATNNGFAFFKPSADNTGYLSDAGVYVAINGVDVSGEEPPLTYTTDGNGDLLTVTTPASEGNSVYVSGDYNFSVDGHAVKIKNVDDTVAVVDGSADAVGSLTFTYGEDEIELNLSNLVVEDDKTLTVLEDGDATKLVPPADMDGDETYGEAAAIKIGSTTYTYTVQADSEAYFILDNGEVSGFVLDKSGDAITVGKNQDIDVFDSENPDEVLTTVDGSNYTIAKTADGYRVTLTNSAEVEIGDTTLNFTLSKATKETLANAGTGIIIDFDEDGEIIGVGNLNRLTNSGDSLQVTAPNVEGEGEGLPVYNTALTAIGGYISVSDGDFTLTGGTTQVLTIGSGETLYDVYTGLEVAIEEGAGTITDGQNEVVYTANGGKFIATAAGNITGYIFENTGDSIVLPTSDAIPVFYDDAQVTVPDIADTDGAFSVALGKDGNFYAGALSEGSTVTGTDGLEITTVDDDNEVIFDADGNIVGVDNYIGTITLPATAGGTFIVNGETLTAAVAGEIKVTGDASGIATVTGLTAGDIVATDDEDSDAEFVFESDSRDGLIDVYTVNGVGYQVINDADGLTITADGNVEGLDDGATLNVVNAPAAGITVNNVEYSKEQLDSGEDIIGYTKKNTEPSSYLDDPNYPLFSHYTNAQIAEALGVDLATNPFFESLGDNVSDHTNDTIQAQVYLDDDGDITTTFSKDLGKNLAVVTADATGTKNIILGDKGDAVIVRGQDENGAINISVGTGNDTIVVGGPSANDAVLRGAATKTNIDMGGTANKDSVDKVITWAAANANITLNNYDETGKSGVVLHDPEIPYIKDLTAAIEDGLLVFENNQVVAIDRDETAEGIDRKTSITVNNVNAAHQSMVRLYGYKDNPDTYTDDFGQLVGFTGTSGGTLNASDIEEDVVLVGNMNGDHKAGSNLLSGDYDDTIFAGGNDTVDAGKGENQIKLTNDANRDAATVIAGAGRDTITGFQTGFNGDVLNIDKVTDKATFTFDGTNFAIADETTKTSVLAESLTANEEYVDLLLSNDGDISKAAVAVEGGMIKVGDEPANFYVANNGGIDFSAYAGDVQIDIDEDWVENKVGDQGVTIVGGVSSLIGGSGNTLFKGGEYNEVLVAGAGESSLYGAGGKNTLIGGVDDKYGSTEFFVQGINKGAQNVIRGFEFIENGGANTATFDNLNLGMSDNNDVIDIKVNGNNVELAVRGNESEATEKVTIEGAAGKEFLVDRGTDSETVAQIAATEVTVNNDYVDYYQATDDSNGATVKVGNVVATEVWLGGAPDDHDHKVADFKYSKFTVVDARGSNATALMAGNDLANTIYGGAGNASMWGGEGSANDLMVGGTGKNEFYYEVGNGNDTIMSSTTGDIIHLGMSLDQVDFDNTNFTSGGLEVTFTDGGKLTINNTNDVTFSFDDGAAVKANQTTKQFE